MTSYSTYSYRRTEGQIMLPGALIIVGTGIQATGQITIEARNCIEQADKVLYFVTEPIAKRYLVSLNSTAESLEHFYEEGKNRFVTYMEMVDRILDEVRKGLNVCVAFYGHPAVFAIPSHEAIKRARREGFYTRMLPGISAQDCLFADIGLDPALPGYQSFDATDFLIRRRRVDTGCSLVLWQIGLIGGTPYQSTKYSPKHLDVLADYLGQLYGPDHEVIIYEAPIYPMFDPVTQLVPVSVLPQAKVSPISTLYVPPNNTNTPLDKDMLQRLGMDEQNILSIVLKLYIKQQVHTYAQASELELADS
jgi:uncharacterized protein YabN with tetrapyrrole methylase and pyrophosphatase domain